MSEKSMNRELDLGIKNRREILGDAWVERSLSNANSFNGEFQHLISRFAWHEIWSRPGLEKKIRRMLVLTTTMAMGRWDEFELHTRAALLGTPETRLTPDELKEVLMQAAVYAGVPAANTGFSLALKILREVAAEIGYELTPVSITNIVHPGLG